MSKEIFADFCQRNPELAKVILPAKQVGGMSPELVPVPSAPLTVQQVPNSPLPVSAPESVNTGIQFLASHGVMAERVRELIQKKG